MDHVVSSAEAWLDRAELDRSGRGGLCHVAPSSAGFFTVRLAWREVNVAEKGINRNREEKNNYPQKLVILKILRHVS